jgi:hypothetical protein
MMQKYFMILMVAICLVSLPGCGGRSNETTAPLGNEVSLKAGQTLKINGESIQIKFIEIESDSRCPAGVTCIWAGEVQCLLEISYGGQVESKTLVKAGGSADFASMSYKEYQLAFDIQPYPQAGKEILKSEYSTKLKVTK